MKFLMTDEGHSVVSNYLVALYMRDLVKKIKAPNWLKNTVANQFENLSYMLGPNKVSKKFKLDGLELFMPALVTHAMKSSPSVVNQHINLSEKIAKSFGEDFRYYACHASFEDANRLLKPSIINMAKLGSEDRYITRTDLRQQANLAYEMANPPYLKTQGSDKQIRPALRPIFNLHLGRIEKEELEKKELYLESVSEIIGGLLNDTSQKVIIAIENLDPGKEGFYNLGEEKKDIEFILKENAENSNIITTYDIGHVDAVEYKRLKEKDQLPKGEKEIAKAFLEYQGRYLERFKDYIGYMHLSFNDIFFFDGKLDQYGIGRHCPLTKAKEQYPLFFKEALVPIVKETMKIIKEKMGKKACINLELPINDHYGQTLVEHGATIQEQLESIRIARKIYELI